MDEYLNTRQKEIFHNLLANPADTGSAYANSLYELVKTYPQSGLFRALHARALNDSNPAMAGAYFDSRALHKLYTRPESLLNVDSSQVVVQLAEKSSVDTIVEDTLPPVEAENSTPPAATEQEEATDKHLTDQPLDFPEVLNVSWMQSPEGEAGKTIAAAEEPMAEATAAATPEPAPVVEEPAVTDETPTEEVAASPEEISDEPVAAEETVAIVPEAEEAPVVVIAEPIQEESPLPQPEPVALKQSQPESYVDDEVFDEITGIEDITIEPKPVVAQPAPEQLEEELPTNAPEPVEATVAEPAEQVTEAVEAPVVEAAEEPKPVTDEAEKLILGNIAATDYFVFDKAFGDNRNSAPAETPAPEPVAEPEPQAAFVAMPQQEAPARTEPLSAEQVQQDLSKYHDEKMPYTFMWWLDKTRQAHGSLYQPYTKTPVSSPVSQNKNAGPVPDALQQQYFENIFHISSVDELAADQAAQTIEFDMQSKEDRIIQRFITEDPHIHPPVGEKLDTENKAKKSSEDNNDMVTETLAKIYADQMLYPKAIATYKKLMLKYPEKSRYFASRIENLEKKTN